jgi:hypothetical protein
MMRLGFFVAGILVLAPSIGCKNDKNDTPKQGPGQAAARAAAAQAASAQELASAMVAQVATKATGSVHSVGGELGTFDVVLSDCHSGEVNGFFGADFYAAGSDDLRLRYVHDEANGDVVKIVFPSKKDTARVFNRQDKCAVLEGSIEKTNVRTWTPKGTIRHVNGHVKFDCAYDGGGHVTGEATFSDCH